MSDLYANFAYAKLTAPVAPGDTELQIDSNARLPSATLLAKGEFYMTIEAPLAAGGFEVVRLTATTATTATVLRAQEGTTAGTHASGAYLKHAVTAAVLRRARAAHTFTNATIPTPPLDPAVYVVGDMIFNASTGVVRVVKADMTLGDIGTSTENFTFTWTATLAAATGAHRLYLDGAYTFASCRLGLGTAPAGQAVIVDVNKNGTSIYTNQANRPTVPIASFTGAGNSPSTTSFAAGDYISVDIDQVGTTTPGSDLTISLRLLKV